jgi:hypothetical protein
MMKRTVVASLVLAVALLTTLPGHQRAFAADATLYELTEDMSFLLDRGHKHRSALSALTGSAAVGTPLCPASLVALLNPGAAACTVHATGSDDIDMGTGTGPFKGKFTVVVQGDNAVDGPELVVMKGNFVGDMDFSPAILRGIPYGTVTGVLKSGPDRFSFSGVFRLPFAGNYAGPETGGATLRQLFCPLTPAPNPYAPIFGGYDLAYVDTSNGAPNGSCIAIMPNELSLGTPLVRFEITFGGPVERDDRR